MNGWNEFAASVIQAKQEQQKLQCAAQRGSAVSTQLQSPCHKAPEHERQAVSVPEAVARKTRSLLHIVRSVPLRFPSSGM